MPYTPTTWTNGSTAANATNMNNLEKQYTEAVNSFEQDLFTAFVHSGLVATKDGITANKLDVTAGVAFLLQSTDNSLRRRAPTSSTQTTSTPSTTYYLDLNADGTWSWGTAHSGVANYLPIAQVTTDGSGNINVVTDKRPLSTTLLNGMSGTLKLGATGNAWVDGSGNIFTTGSMNVGPAGNVGFITWYAAGRAWQLWSPQSGAATWIELVSWNGTTSKVPLGIGSASSGNTATYFDDNGNLQGAAGFSLPTTRNGVATSVPLYTGTGTPSSPPTGSVWIKA